MKNIITIIAISLLSVGCAMTPTGSLPIELDYARHIKVNTDNSNGISKNELMDVCIKIFNYDRLSYKTQYHKNTKAVFRPELTNTYNGYEVFTNVQYFDGEDHNYRKIRCRFAKLSNNDYLYIEQYATGGAGGLVKRYIPKHIPGTLYHKSIE